MGTGACLSSGYLGISSAFGRRRSSAREELPLEKSFR
jgi:hypothetical protein